MVAHKDFEVKARKRIYFVVMCLSFVAIYGFAKGIYNQVSEYDTFSPGIFFGISMNMIFCGLAAIIAWFSFRRWRFSGPGLLITSLGLIDHSGMVSAGMIYWQDITGINSNKIVFSECIHVKVKNPERYIRNKKNIFERYWLRMEYRYLGSPVHISVSGLKIKFTELFRIVQEYYLSMQVASRTFELRREKEIIQVEKKALVDSINYAKRIQNALLPSPGKIEKTLGENFILFLPKDIVSGDFYWVETRDNWVFFAACDCTGHGVPGALISIVCVNALNRAIREFGLNQPGQILDKVAEIIVESMGLDGEVKDGMEASLCAFNTATRELYWAGANCPLWIGRKNEKYEMVEVKPDKQSVGLVENRVPYTNHKISVRGGDVLYLFSDGYADQFGGVNGKKLTRKRLKDLLIQLEAVPMDAQYKFLLNEHIAFKGNGEQIDDILLMGILIER